jgi:hypothetical protein
MPKAGFWAIGGYRISFRKDGRWYADEEPIANEKISRLFSQHVRRDAGGQWVIDVGIDCQAVTVDDTALVVTAVDGDGPNGFCVRANDGETSDLDCATLALGADGALYCDLDRGERGTIRARFLRPAHYALMSSMDADAVSGAPVLSCRGRRYVLPRSS